MLENNQKEIILLEDLGMKFPNVNSKQKKRYGLYKCFCGKEFETQSYYIKIKHTQSCGCHNINQIKKRSITHNLSNHRLYNTWLGMISRCTDKNNPRYKDYGGRGITVCQEWNNLENFINDMFPIYQEGLTIDRENLNGNYEKSNCRWATIVMQNRNTRVLQVNNNSGYRGVSYNKKLKKYSSSITVNRKNIHLGYFNNALEAGLCRDKYIIKNNLEHTLNFDRE